MPARVKLKGIDGGPHKRWSMWFDDTRGTLPGFDIYRNDLEISQRSNASVYRCCMAVVSSCREVLG